MRGLQCLEERLAHTVFSRLNAGARTPGPNCRFLIKRRGPLIGAPAFDRGPGWMAETEHEITPAGQIKAPSRRSCVERILSTWESLK